MENAKIEKDILSNFQTICCTFLCNRPGIKQKIKQSKENEAKLLVQRDDDFGVRNKSQKSSVM